MQKMGTRFNFDGYFISYWMARQCKRALQASFNKPTKLDRSRYKVTAETTGKGEYVWQFAGQQYSMVGGGGSFQSEYGCTSPVKFNTSKEQ